MTTTTDRYREVRRGDPYMGAATALAIARGSIAAEQAGMGRHVYDDDPEAVTIDGEGFTVHYHADDHLNDHGWDCLGHVRERKRDPYGHGWPLPQEVPWPCVPLPAGYDGSGTQGGYYGALETYYDPGDTYEPWHPRGMARMPAREWEHATLVAEGLRVRSTFTIGIELTDGDGRSASLWGIDSPGSTWAELAYRWGVAQDLAYEIRAERAAEAERIAREVFTRLTMQLP